MNALLAIVFLMCAGTVVYAYLGYPLVIWLLSRLVGVSAPPPHGTAELPMVSLLVAAHNEEAVIESWIENALSISYPRDRLEMVVASDHSTDGTAAIVRRYADRRVKLVDHPVRRGKAGVLNATIPLLGGEIVVLTDANTVLNPAAIRHMVSWFTDPEVTTVSGRLQLIDPATGRNTDGLYWKYETFIKRCETRLNALLGANGALYAIRRSRFVPVPGDTIVDDFVIPLLARLKSGGRIVYEPAAIASETTAPDIGSEFRRRARIGAGDFHSIGLLWKLLDPRQGWIAFSFFSHKLLRWTCPFFMAGAFISSAMLFRHPVFLVALIAQISFYTLSLVVGALPADWQSVRPLRLTTMFTSMNASLLVGFVRWLTGSQRPTWDHTTRVPEPHGGGLGV